ncbi:hypothetical protein [Paraburkholderia sp. BL6669N2]|uniref:hypothetical protein n=1 Tax=Paraburkholderia sp. BL6669N2 TaxID=1938807 RepID=UPI0011C078DF|nr:hypothetical protein [Paraburkholderia sp. BL6669N2]
MFRIDDPSAATSLPTPEAAGTEGYWTEGNPASGTPATLERASWFNMIQEELRAIVVAAGLTPSKTTYTQVRDAITNMMSPGRLLGVQVFTTSGTYTPGVYTVGGRSVTATKIRVRAIGAGGGRAVARQERLRLKLRSRAAVVPAPMESCSSGRGYLRRP